MLPVLTKRRDNICGAQGRWFKQRYLIALTCRRVCDAETGNAAANHYVRFHTQSRSII
jgi:hypothetical protein